MCLSLIDLSAVLGASILASHWPCNKLGGGLSWWSGSYSFFNLPDASHWQRLITRWHCAVMVTLTHLLGRGEGGRAEATSADVLEGARKCERRLAGLILPLLPLVKVLLRVAPLSLPTRSPAASLTRVHQPYLSHRAEQHVRVSPC